MSVSGIEAIGFTPYVPPQMSGTSAVGSTGSSGAATRAAGAASTGTDFGDLVLDGIDRLQSAQQTSDSLAVKAATGDLSNIHDYTIAASQASVMTQVTVALRNKAVEAFTEIMRMQV